MKKLYIILLIPLMCFTFASTAHAETSDLLKLLGDRDFWASFSWGKFEDSQLYKAAEWRPPGWPGRAGVTVTSTYTIKITWAELGVDMTLYEDSGVNAPDAERKDLKSIWGVTGEDDYLKIVEWCSKNFGDAVIKDEKTEIDDPTTGLIRYTVKSSWDVGNATATVRSEQVTSRARKISHPYKTYLKFERYFSRKVALEKKEGEEKARRGDVEGVSP